MTITPGQLGHTDDHTLMVEQLKGEITRFGLTPDPKLGGPYALGAPGHIEQHNVTVAELQRVATTGGITLPALPDAAALGDGGHIHDHELMRAALDLIRQADAYNAATGGTVTEHWDGSKMWRIHTFLDSDTLTVTKDVGRPFQLLLVAGGGGPGGSQPYNIVPGGGGGGGVLLVDSATLGVGSHAVTVGKAGGQGPENGQGQQGGNSSLGGHTAIGGGGGGSYHAGPGVGGSGGGGSPSGSQGGAAGTPGQGYAGGNGWESGGPQFKTESGAGGGAGGPATHGGWDIPSQRGPGRIIDFRGTPELFGVGGNAYYGTGYGLPGSHDGGVMVKYEIAPWNSATGGTVTDVPNYNGSGETWRVHTFLSDGVFIPSSSTQPFRVLAVGGGGGGGGSGGTTAGGPGNGSNGIDTTITLAAGTYPVVVGAGGAGMHYGWETGGTGGSSSISTISRPGGTGGAPNNGGWTAGNGGPTSNITGTTVAYAQGGGWGTTADVPGAGAGGGGQSGRAGIVVVAYRIG